MKEIPEAYKDVIIQVATPSSTGTGFYLKDYDAILTRENIIRDNREAIIDGSKFSRQLSRVLVTDPVYDLAILEAPEAHEMPSVTINQDAEVKKDDEIWAIGHPLGAKCISRKGKITEEKHVKGNIAYYSHDAVLGRGYGGGPLINESGEIIGLNIFIAQESHEKGIALPASPILELLQAFKDSGKRVGTRCPSCNHIVFENNIERNYCPYCGSKVLLPTHIEEEELEGVAKTIEELLIGLGYNSKIARRGPNNWELQKGSARINISYYEKNGLITGDAFLCTLPENNPQAVYEYLLKENYRIEGLTLSVKEEDIILSLLIYDRYLNSETGMRLFGHLLEKADYYDNVLVEEFGARWKQEDS